MNTSCPDPSRSTAHQARAVTVGRPRQFAKPRRCPACGAGGIECLAYPRVDDTLGYDVTCEDCGWTGDIRPAVYRPVADIALDAETEQG